MCKRVTPRRKAEKCPLCKSCEAFVLYQLEPGCLNIGRYTEHISATPFPGGTRTPELPTKKFRLYPPLEPTRVPHLGHSFLSCPRLRPLIFLVAPSAGESSTCQRRVSATPKRGRSESSPYLARLEADVDKRGCGYALALARSQLGLCRPPLHAPFEIAARTIMIASLVAAR